MRTSPVILLSLASNTKVLVVGARHESETGILADARCWKSAKIFVAKCC